MADSSDRTPEANTGGRAGPSVAEAEAAVTAEDRRAQASGDRRAPLAARDDRRSPMMLAVAAAALLVLIALIAWIL